MPSPAIWISSRAIRRVFFNVCGISAGGTTLQRLSIITSNPRHTFQRATFRANPVDPISTVGWRNGVRKRRRLPDLFGYVNIGPPVEALTAPLTKELKGHSYVVRCACFSPNGKYLLSGSADTPGKKEEAGELVLWDASTGMRLHSLKLDVLSAQYSADSLHIAATSMDGLLHIINVKGLNHESEMSMGEYCPRVAKYSPDNKHLLVGCYDGTVLMLSPRSREIITVLPGHTGPVVFVGYSNDGKSVVTASMDGTVQVWQADSCTLKTRINTSHKLNALDISPNAKLIASANQPEDTLSWTEEETQITLWDADTGRELGKLSGHTSPVNSLAFDPNGKYLLSGAGAFISNQDNSVRLWEIETRRGINIFAGHSSGVTSVSFSPDRKRFVSSSWDRTVRVWEIAGASTQPKSPDHTGDTFGLSFSPNGRWLASSAWDDLRILLWEAETGRLVRALEGHESLIRCFRFSDDSQYLVSGSGSKYEGVDCMVRLWHVETGRQVAVFEGQPVAEERHGHVNPVKTVGFSNDGRHIISGHADLLSVTQAVSVIRVWDRYTGELVDCFAGSGDQADELIKSETENLLVEVLEQGMNRGGGVMDHP